MSGDHARAVELLERIDAFQSVYAIGKYTSRFIKATKCALSLLNVCDDFMAEPFHHFLPPERKKVRQILEMFTPAEELAD